MSGRREFPAKTREDAYARSGGRCEYIIAGARCQVKLRSGNIEYDHVLPDWLGGKATLENCCVCCKACHKVKTALDVPRIAKTKRQARANINARAPKAPIPARPPREKPKLDKLPFPGRRKNTLYAPNDERPDR